MDLDPVTHLIMLVIGFAGVVLGLFTIFHAVLQRADAFTAAGRLTKPKWLGICAAGTVGCALFLLSSGWFIFFIAGLVANLVYLVDVRPRVNEVQRGSQW